MTGLGPLLKNTDVTAGAIPFKVAANVMAHSITLGFILVAVTFVYSKALENLSEENSEKLGPKKSGLQAFIGSCNLLFLSVGLTGIMILINDNLVRAFSIVAALALIRFRIKVDHKKVTTPILFAMLSGMACGAQEISLAWASLLVYAFLATGTYLMMRVFHKLESQKNQRTLANIQTASPRTSTIPDFYISQELKETQIGQKPSESNH